MSSPTDTDTQTAHSSESPYEGTSDDRQATALCYVYHMYYMFLFFKRMYYI